MGYYIEAPSPKGKAHYLYTKYEAEYCRVPERLEDIPEDKALVVVVDNHFFEAAALAYSQQELEAFSDPRPKEFLLMDKEVAHKLAGYKE